MEQKFGDNKTKKIGMILLLLVVLGTGVYILCKPIVIKSERYKEAIERYWLLASNEETKSRNMEAEYMKLVNDFSSLSSFRDANTYYQKSLDLLGQYYYDNGAVMKAYESLKAAGYCEKNHALMQKISRIYPDSVLYTAAQGDVVTLGRYEQDGNLENGSEELEWIVLKTERTKKLLITKYCIEALPYHNEEGKILWKDSYINIWLNFSFYEMAFDEKERACILTTSLKDTYNPDYNTWAEGTEARIFLLSAEEYQEWIGNHPEAGEGEFLLSQYMINRGASACTGYWLRTPGIDYDGAACAAGRLISGGDGCVVYNLVRPAVWIDAAQLEHP